MIEQLFQICFMLFNNFATGESIRSFTTDVIERVLTWLNDLQNHSKKCLFQSKDFWLKPEISFS